MLQARSEAAEPQPAKITPVQRLLDGRLLIWAAAAAVIASGFVRYIKAPSFWLDEAFVAVSIRTRSLSELFAPLDYAQFFPRLYMALIVMLRNVVGYQVWSLRLLPFLCYIVATLLWARLLVKRAGKRLLLGALSGALLLGAIFWLEQSIQLKQYTLDVLTALIPFLLDDDFFTEPLVDGRRQTRLILLAIPCCFSYSYPMALGARIGGWYLQQWRYQGWRLHWRGVAILIIAVALGCISIWLTDHRFNAVHQSTSLVYWHEAMLRPRFAEGVRSGFGLIADYLWGWYPGRLMPVMIAVVAPLQALGLYQVMRRLQRREAAPDNTRWGSRTLGSIILLGGVVLASALADYPMIAGRLTLFTQVHVQLLIIEGGLFVLTFRNWRKLAVSFLSAAAAIVIVYSGYRYIDFMRLEPIENIRPLLPLIKPEIAQTLWVNPCSSAQVDSLPDALPVSNLLMETKHQAFQPSGKTWVLWTNTSDDYCHKRLDEIKARALSWQVIQEGPGRGLALADFQ